MKRLGHFTGKIYDEQVDHATIGECCTLIDDNGAKDEVKIEEMRNKYQSQCKRYNCFGCPEARGEQ